MKKIFLTFYFLLFTFYFSSAQFFPPAPVQDSSILLMNGTAHLGNGTVIQNSVIKLEHGKITLIADATTIKLANDPSTKKINCYGKQIYPGLIATNTDLGLSEIELVRATNDYNEVGDFNSDVRSIIAYNTDSRVIPTVRSNGVLLAQTVPQGGTISGSSSVVQLDAWNWEDAAYKTDEGIHLNWPSWFSFSFDFETGQGGIKQNDDYTKQVNSIREFFTAAKAYGAEATHENKNLKYEAMQNVFTKTANLYIHADELKQILAAVQFIKDFGVRGVIVGGRDSYLCAKLLSDNSIPVILFRPQSLPAYDDVDYDQPYKTAAELQKAGVLFCITDVSFWQQRNLPFQAGQTVAFGLSKEDALSAITLNAAKILGIDSTCGSLEIGKDATLIISDGDILDMKTSNVTMAFINGRNINLDNAQTQLYEIYKKKYGIK